jgi:phytoene dehydrogenase-like protein
MAIDRGGSRRDFLRALAVLLGGQYLTTGVSAADRKTGAKDASGSAYKLADWTGDEFELCHRLRVGDLAALPEKADQKVDFVIVGGGLSGLTAAYELKSEDFILLEQSAETGGHARGSSYRGLAYSYGAAYVAEVDGIFGELYASLGLKPATLAPPYNQFYYNSQWFCGLEGNTEKPFYKEFARLLQDARPLWKDLPQEPAAGDLRSPDLQKLDASSFASCLNGYSKEFVGLLDRCCCWSSGGTSEQLSALAGYLLVRDLSAPTHVFKGGNQAITRALSERIASAGKGRCRTGAFVWKIDIKEDGASVTYSLKDGSSHRVDCRYVIVATPPLAASRQLLHIPDLLKAQLFRFKYCSYLVANFLMKEKLFKGKYDNFVGPPLSFADLTVAETPYMALNSYKPEMGSVLTVYQPYPGGSEGRSVLLEGNREKIAAGLIDQLQSLVPGLKKSVDQIVLSRWGHALAVVSPGYFSRLAKLHELTAGGACSLAHSATIGRQNSESAVSAGRQAAASARKSAAKPGAVVK